ncbi:MAG: DUF1294 domain-containing protein [Hylemonella sp.]|jgi:uncharacterized membrane protein YsdA (DUF1294 family)|uniref:DUF1294 domain-containing protein n=1 Tax=Hylemonella sp. TaxID=2066020 RepID=UPI00391A1A22
MSFTLLLITGTLVMSLLSYALYAADKRAAHHRRRRVPERTLHLLALLGGWPGALLAQRHLRHKTAKPRFLLVYWLTVAGHVAAVAASATLR